MRMHSGWLVIAIAFSAGQAVSEPIRVNFEGIVNEIIDVEGLLDQSVKIGTTFSGYYVFDSERSDLDGRSDRGEYGWYSWMGPQATEGFDFRVVVGSYGFILSAHDPGAGILVYNDLLYGWPDTLPVVDGYSVGISITQFRGPSIPFLTPSGNGLANLILRTTTNLSAFTSDSLPLVPPDLDLFETNTFFVTNGSSQSQVAIRGPITSLTRAPVPEPDTDGDGVPDAEDQCPNSILTPTVIIEGCDSIVSNTLFPTGCSISDNGSLCATGTVNHGEFVSCVAQYLNDLMKAKVLTGRQKGSIQACAGLAVVP